MGHSRPSSPWQTISRLLVVRLDNMGDVVLLSPALRALKAALPHVSITLLASPAGQHAAALLPWINDVIVWRAVWQDVGGSLPFDPWRERVLIANLAQQQFDAAIIFTSFSQTAHVPGYVCYLAGIPLRAGMVKEFGGSVLTTEIRHEPDCQHQAERNIRLVEHLGFPVVDRRLEVRITPTGMTEAHNLLAHFGLTRRTPYVLIHPGASCQARRYPPHRFAIVIEELIRLGLPVVITGTERERSFIEPLLANQRSGVYPIIGQTSLPAFAALIDSAAVVVCGNTLPLHLADALGTPVVALYSGTDLEVQWAPRFTPHRILRRPTPCTPCYRFTCAFGDEQPCLDIDPATVVEAISSLLDMPPTTAEPWSPERGDHARASQ
ncbi:glycosyltransferase family 9 protein [Thermorudis peleae]|uniref:glycosyltransferase family 9 protein n=1 Tax=Thermorudis peleae TaxID=1382356 RepID=UPI0018CD1C1E|nr:glycosyltransferase family 9 protein [Thermorudis peleae]